MKNQVRGVMTNYFLEEMMKMPSCLVLMGGKEEKRGMTCLEGRGRRGMIQLDFCEVEGFFFLDKFVFCFELFFLFFSFSFLFFFFF